MLAQTTYPHTPPHHTHLHQLQVCQHCRICEGCHEHIHHASTMQHVTVHCSDSKQQQ